MSGRSRRRAWRVVGAFVAAGGIVSAAHMARETSASVTVICIAGAVITAVGVAIREANLD